MIIVPVGVREDIRRHAAECYPHECCGILLGRAPAAEERVGAILLSRAIPAPNTAETGQRHNRYLIDPRAILHTDNLARAEHLEILGFYHSHPDHPAAPSRTDSDLAWPDYVYLICSIAAPGGHDLRGWRLSPETRQFEEIALSP